MSVSIEVHLDYLASAKEAVEELKQERNNALDVLFSSIPVELQQAIEDAKANYLERITNAEGIVSQMEATVKKLVVDKGATVKGDKLQAVYAAGRISWDSKGLQGYAAAVPDLWQFAKQGEPSVTIREVK